MKVLPLPCKRLDFHVAWMGLKPTNPSFVEKREGKRMEKGDGKDGSKGKETS